MSTLPPELGKWIERLSKALSMDSPEQLCDSLTRFKNSSTQYDYFTDRAITNWHGTAKQLPTRRGKQLITDFLTDHCRRYPATVVDSDYVKSFVRACTDNKYPATTTTSAPPQPWPAFDSLYASLSSSFTIRNNEIANSENYYSGYYTIVRKSLDDDTYHEELLSLQGRHSVTENLINQTDPNGNNIVLSGISIFAGRVVTSFIFSPDDKPRLTFRAFKVQLPATYRKSDIYSGIILGVDADNGRPTATPIALIPNTKCIDSVSEKGITHPDIAREFVRCVHPDNESYNRYRNLGLDSLMIAHDHREFVKRWRKTS
jgi:hypothetical protein